MKTYHPNGYLLPFAHACGGTGQDIGLEGRPAAHVNLQFLVLIFNDQLSISTNNLLQKSLEMTLQSVEFITMLMVLSMPMLRVLIMLYSSVNLQVRNAQDLGGYDFGVMGMGTVIDTLESAMEDVADNRELFFDVEHMFIFSDLQKN